MLKRILRWLLPAWAILVAQELRSSVRPKQTHSGELSDFHHEVIRPEILQRWQPTVIEIGVLDGSHTRLLLAACLKRFGRVISIDPSPGKRIANVMRFHPWGTMVEETSLEALPKLVARGITADVALIDGDHNYYTVFHELMIIESFLSPTGVVFLHDVGWPYGRRDLYYVPERIPAQERHPFAKRGIIRGKSELSDMGGKNNCLDNALHEGGPRNGVLTAVEDFVARAPERWTLEIRPDVHGVGILSRRATTSKPPTSYG
jgi:hypothetical protein